MSTRQTTDTPTAVYATSDTPYAGGAVATIAMPVTPKMFSQLGIAVLDGSSSMEEETKSGNTKAREVNGAIREFFTRMKASRNRGNFEFALVTFDHQATLRMDITPTDLVDDNASYDPMSGHGGGTFIGGGLQEAKAVAQRFLANARPDMPATVVVLLMTDAECNRPAESQIDIDALKAVKGVRVCTTYFARVGQPNPAAQDYLRQAATDPINGYKTVYDAETLRAFFEASMTAGIGG